MSQTESRSHWPLSLLGGGVSLLNLALPLVLVRLLTPDEVGRYKIFFLYLALFPLFAMTAGLTNGLAHWAGHSAQRVQAFRSSWTLQVLAALIVLGVGHALAPQAAEVLGWSLSQMRLFVSGGAIVLLAGFFEEATVATGQIWRGALFNSFFELARGGTILACALVFRSIEAVFLGYIVMMAVKLALGSGWGFAEGFQRLQWEAPSLKSVFAYALPVSLSAALSIISGYADQLVLSRTLSAAEFASYSLGCLLVPPLIIFEQSVNRVLIPRMSHDFAEGRGTSARALFREAMSELSWLLIPSAFGTMLFAPEIVDLLFTDRYASAADYLRVFAFSHLVNMIPYDVVARARGNARVIFTQIATTSAVSLLTIYPAAHFFGPMGALVTVTAIAFCLRVGSLQWVRVREGWSFSKMLPLRDWLQYCLAALVATSVALALRFPLGPTQSWFAVGGSAFAVVYLTLTAGLFLRRRALGAERPRVLLLTQYLSLGGLERMILNLARGIQSQGAWDPVVVVYDQLAIGAPSLHGAFEAAGIPVTTLQKKGGLSLKVVAAVARQVVREKVVVIHSHDLGALIYATLAKIATLGGVRVVHTQHSFVHLERHPRYRAYERFFSFFADELTTVAENLRELYPSVGIPKERVAVVPNGIEFPHAPLVSMEARRAARAKLVDEAQKGGLASAQDLKLLRESLDRPWVLCMARVHPKKGQDQVLKVWEKLPPGRRADAVLIFVGAETSPGALAQLRAGLQALPEPAQALYAGFTLEPTLWLQASDIYISGSEFEGMPLGPLEAVGAGLLTLVSDIPGHRMVPASAKRFALGDASEGAQKLLVLLDQALVTDEQARQARWASESQARSAFGIEAMTARYVAAYTAR